MDVRNLRRDNFKSGPHLTRSAAFVQCGALDKKACPDYGEVYFSPEIPVIGISARPRAAVVSRIGVE